ncbi:hypothetical protein [Roseomonas indoligenes]|uniref:Uncharacterized protein n=1 Tax=Roseomonas indoligenes TaxID=2820811 RepID=A0A940N0D8_9PROT|nr:hypothetical protein [Pararoseomonas indoligenes]MBP0494214.1 hypothetical protein [Pararoseomonas indoligenes]
MHKPLFLAAALALTGAAGLAVAQPAPPAPPAPGAAAPLPAPPPPLNPQGPGPQAQGPRGPMGGPMGGPGFEGPRGPMGGPEGRMRGWHHPPRSESASFFFQKDDSVIHIHCAEDEPTRACVDAASTLIDKLATMPNR